MKKLYAYEAPKSTWVRCAICNMFRIPTLEFDSLREHITESHPHDCYDWEGNLFINHREMKNHKQLEKIAKMEWYE